MKEPQHVAPSGRVSFYTNFDMVHQIHLLGGGHVGDLRKDVPAHILVEQAKEMEQAFQLVSEAFAALQKEQTDQNKADLVGSLAATHMALMSVAVSLGVPYDQIFAVVIAKITSDIRGQNVPVPSLLQVITASKQAAEEQQR